MASDKPNAMVTKFDWNTWWGEAKDFNGNVYMIHGTFIYGFTARAQLKPGTPCRLLANYSGDIYSVVLLHY